MNRLYKASALSCLLIFSAVAVHAQWLRKPSGTSANLKAIAGNRNGSLLVAGDGTIIKSDDTGATWYQVLNANCNFTSIVFPSKNYGLAIPNIK